MVTQTKIAILIGSIRPNRFGQKVAEWFFSRASTAADTHFDIVDIKDYDLPLLDEPTPPGNARQHTKIWQAKMAQYDGYVIVTPEYNYGIAASLKNALDYTSDQLHYKPVAYIGYGGVGAVRAISQLRQIAASFKQYDLRANVSFAGQGNFGQVDNKLTVEQSHEKNADALILEIGFWAKEMTAIRRKL